MDSTASSPRNITNANISLQDVLNDDVIGVIKGFLPKETRVWLTKEDYITNHSVIKQLIPPNCYDQYIHDVIKHDHSFVFTQILREQFDKFHNWKKFMKNGNRHHSYLTYLRDMCVERKSLKCACVIDEFAAVKGFSPNWYKRKSIIISTTSKPAGYNN
jgi:hypothetical protein